MTKEEAIKILKAKCACTVFEISGEQKEALDVAIKALEELCGDCVSREKVIRIIKNHPRIVGDRSILVQKVVEL